MKLVFYQEASINTLRC